MVEVYRGEFLLPLACLIGEIVLACTGGKGKGEKVKEWSSSGDYLGGGVSVSFLSGLAAVRSH